MDMNIIPVKKSTLAGLVNDAIAFRTMALLAVGSKEETERHERMLDILWEMSKLLEEE